MTETSKLVDIESVEPLQALRLACGSPSVPKVYGNQFSTFGGTHDVAVMFGSNGVPTGVLHMSYMLAKALGKSLDQAVRDYEKLADLEVPDLGSLEAKMSANSKR